MKVKVCGMKYRDNIADVMNAQPDYLGFIFYPKSKRYAGEVNEKEIPESNGIARVGVFVNESFEKIKETCSRFKIKYVQLHGDESPALCESLKSEGFKIIKVFSVGEDFDFSTIEPYNKVADYFLFDTKSENYGGTGKKFNWEVFRNYKNNKEVFLSGGIGPEDVEEIKKLNGIKIHAVDINSCFEVEPAMKDATMVKDFIDKIRQ